jgi:hypothetical protein
MTKLTSATTLRLALVAVLTLLPFTATLAHAQAAPPGRTGSLSVPITGTVTDLAATTITHRVAGTLAVQRFVVRSGQLLAQGTFTGTITDAATNAVRNVVTQIAMPVATGAQGATATATAAAAPAVTAASCEILNLVLGPLDLNLLGLRVHLDQVVLDITAVPGGGNLLGNLLCSIAGLLDGGLSGVLGQVAALLNQLLGILG